MRNLPVIIWLLFCSATCNHITSSPDLIFINATYQAWSGGAAGSGHGVYYNFYFLDRKITTLKFDSVWVDSYVLPVQVIKHHDTLQVSAGLYQRDKQFRPNTSDTIKYERFLEFPVPAANAAAVVRYTADDNKRYATVPFVKRLRPISYP